MDEDEVRRFAVGKGYADIERARPWNGYEVYLLIPDILMEEGEVPIIGPPIWALIEGDSIRIADAKETFECEVYQSKSVDG
ncbi:MAG: hypothetical protein Q4Q58_05725 [Thermoplasmata archaeon]|nr:hypothetical protein [Thermoplasmata archaeon]